MRIHPCSKQLEEVELYLKGNGKSLKSFSWCVCFFGKRELSHIYLVKDPWGYMVVKVWMGTRQKARTSSVGSIVVKYMKNDNNLD